MEIQLEKNPKSPTVIVGFPGIGLIGPIVTEFLIEHMKTERIGTFVYDSLPPTAAIHKGALIHPMSLHYSKEHNALILYTILNVRGQEWAIAHEVAKLAEKIKAKEILCIDGAGVVGGDSQIFSFGDQRFVRLGAEQMKESVITGVTGALLLLRPDTKALFAATDMEMPNAKAAARVVEFLDKHLDLKVDPKPLLQQARQFEEKLKSLAEQSKRAMDDQEKRKLDYLG